MSKQSSGHLTDAELEAWLTKQRAEQGLPPRIEDVAVLTRIATIMRLAVDVEPAPVDPAAGRRRRK